MCGKGIFLAEKVRREAMDVTSGRTRLVLMSFAGASTYIYDQQ